MNNAAEKERFCIESQREREEREREKEKERERERKKRIAIKRRRENRSFHNWPLSLANHFIFPIHEEKREIAIIPNREKAVHPFGIYTRSDKANQNQCDGYLRTI